MLKKIFCLWRPAGVTSIQRPIEQLEEESYYQGWFIKSDV